MEKKVRAARESGRRNESLSHETPGVKRNLPQTRALGLFSPVEMAGQVGRGSEPIIKRARAAGVDPIATEALLERVQRVPTWWRTLPAWPDFHAILASLCLLCATWGGRRSRRRNRYERSTVFGRQTKTKQADDEE
jgi:hypothetical protein